jgi:hypothetical protein
VREVASNTEEVRKELAIMVDSIRPIVAVEMLRVDPVVVLIRTLEANTLATFKAKVVVNVEGLVITMEET